MHAFATPADRSQYHTQWRTNSQYVITKQHITAAAEPDVHCSVLQGSASQAGTVQLPPHADWL